MDLTKEDLAGFDAVVDGFGAWEEDNENHNATYVCINTGEADTAKDISDHSICINGDIDKAINDL